MADLNKILSQTPERDKTVASGADQLITAVSEADKAISEASSKAKDKATGKDGDAIAAAALQGSFKVFGVVKQQIDKDAADKAVDAVGKRLQDKELEILKMPLQKRMAALKPEAIDQEMAALERDALADVADRYKDPIKRKIRKKLMDMSFRVQKDNIKQLMKDRALRMDTNAEYAAELATNDPYIPLSKVPDIVEEGIGVSEEDRPQQTRATFNKFALAKTAGLIKRGDLKELNIMRSSKEYQLLDEKTKADISQKIKNSLDSIYDKVKKPDFNTASSMKESIQRLTNTNNPKIDKYAATLQKATIGALSRKTNGSNLTVEDKKALFEAADGELINNDDVRRYIEGFNNMDPQEKASFVDELTGGDLDRIPPRNKPAPYTREEADLMVDRVEEGIINGDFDFRNPGNLSEKGAGVSPGETKEAVLHAAKRKYGKAAPHKYTTIWAAVNGVHTMLGVPVGQLVNVFNNSRKVVPSRLSNRVSDLGTYLEGFLGIGTSDEDAQKNLVDRYGEEGLTQLTVFTQLLAIDQNESFVNTEEDYTKAETDSISMLQKISEATNESQFIGRTFLPEVEERDLTDTQVANAIEYERLLDKDTLMSRENLYHRPDRVHEYIHDTSVEILRNHPDSKVELIKKNGLIEAQITYTVYGFTRRVKLLDTTGTSITMPLNQILAGEKPF